jgi:hypothetical protein
MEQKSISVEYVGVIAPPTATPALTPEAFAKGPSTVTMIFEKPVLLTIQHGLKVAYPKGVHEVPQKHSDHWYLRAHGVIEYNKPIAATAPQQQRSQSRGANRNGGK